MICHVVNNNSKVGLPHRSAPRNDRAAFTLAEVLITLGVIGIVAAMTMPLLINNNRVKYLENRFKKSSVILETALNDTMQEFALEVLLKTESNLKYVNYRISDTQRQVINDYFKSRFTDVQTRNMNQVWNINSYSKSGALLGTYGGGLTFSQNTSYPRELWLLPDGMSITPINFQEHNIYDGLKVILDTNGPYKGPNRYGYDVFVYDSGNYAVDVCADEAKNIMSIYGCYNYAKANQNPDDSTKEYWESLK